MRRHAFMLDLPRQQPGRTAHLCQRQVPPPWSTEGADTKGSSSPMQLTQIQGRITPGGQNGVQVTLGYVLSVCNFSRGCPSLGLLRYHPLCAGSYISSFRYTLHRCTKPVQVIPTKSNPRSRKSEKEIQYCRILSAFIT